MGQFSKPWEELNISDNYIFCKVMRNKKLCAELLEILLGFKVRDITYIESEHPIEDYYDTRGIRMDVYVEGSTKIYDIEMQTGDYEDLLMRARYYQSASDVSSTPRRTRFKDLKETYILFICKDDPFGAGLPLYTEFKKFRETDEISYDDKTYKLFYNSSAFAKAKDEDISAVLEFIYTLKAKSNFTKSLQSSVIDAKAEPLFRSDYMYFADLLEDEKEKAREAGLAEGVAAGRAEGLEKGLAEGRVVGLAEGRAEGRTEGLTEGHAKGLAEGVAQGLAEGIQKASLKSAVTAVKEFNIPLEQVAEKFNVPLEELKKNL